MEVGKACFEARDDSIGMAVRRKNRILPITMAAIYHLRLRNSNAVQYRTITAPFHTSVLTMV
jgi:hypothetical protein